MSVKSKLGLKELIAIAIGGMVGGGIFTILGISVSMAGIFLLLGCLDIRLISVYRYL